MVVIHCHVGCHPIGRGLARGGEESNYYHYRIITCPIIFLFIHINQSICPLFIIYDLNQYSVIIVHVYAFFVFFLDRLRVLIPTMVSSSSSSTTVFSTTASSCVLTATAFFRLFALIDFGTTFLLAIHTSSSTGYRSNNLYNWNTACSTLSMSDPFRQSILCVYLFLLPQSSNPHHRLKEVDSNQETF